MNKILLLIIYLFVIIYSVDGDDKITCDIRGGFKICKKSGVLLSVDQTTHYFRLYIFDKEITSIAPNAFRNLTISDLILGLADKQLDLNYKSFNGLPRLKLLEFESGIVPLKSNLFKSIKLINNFKFIVNGGKQSLIEILPDELKCLNTLSVQLSTNINSIGSDVFFKFYPTVLHLILRKNKIASIEKRAFTSFKSLETLEITNTDILNNLRPGTFDELDSLKYLYLNWNGLTSISKNIFNKLVKVVRLELAFNKIKNIEIESFSGMIKLQILKLQSNQIKHLENDIFIGMPGLRELSINKNYLKYIPKNIFNRLQNLTHLKLGWNEINKIETDAFFGLDLSYLILGCNNIDVIEIGAFQGLTTDDLILSNNNIIHIDNKAFQNSTIGTIHMYNVNLTVDKVSWGLRESTRIFYKKSYDEEMSKMFKYWDDEKFGSFYM